ncbi:MAG: putative lipid II flippase FtsW [Myxococcales bacterium]|nr:putative lipid II flippase FtsW [Myxococcales bacterium]
MMPMPADMSAEDVGQGVDRGMALCAAFLLLIGVAAVYSGSAVLAAERFGSSTYFLTRHLGAVLVAICIIFGVLRCPLEWWSRVAYPLLFVSFVLLVITVTTSAGSSANGSERWLQIGSFRFQPAELAKFSVVIYLAHSLAKKREQAKTFSMGFLPHVGVVSVLVCFVLKQPDLGTSVVIYATLGTMLFVAGTRTAYLVLATLGAAPVLLLYLRYYPHAWRRIQVFFAPESDPTGAGYQVYQSLVAFGSGGMFGMGLGGGSQKLYFLPEPHTDLIYAGIGQELGFFGACSVLMAFVLLVCRGLTVASRLPCRFPMFLTFGLATSVGIQAFINMGVAVALLPTKGLTLPLVSFGRSSMVVSALSVGILLRASTEEITYRRSRGRGPRLK